VDTLTKHLPVNGSEGLLELQKIAQRFEDKIFTAATSEVHTLTLRIMEPPFFIYGYICIHVKHQFFNLVSLFFLFSLIIDGKYL
jgi:hypothetical protein